jgi:hypothetical protein
MVKLWVGQTPVERNRRRVASSLKRGTALGFSSVPLKAADIRRKYARLFDSTTVSRQVEQIYRKIVLRFIRHRPVTRSPVRLYSGKCSNYAISYQRSGRGRRQLADHAGAELDGGAGEVMAAMPGSLVLLQLLRHALSVGLADFERPFERKRLGQIAFLVVAGLVTE